MPQLTINGKTCSFEKGETILQAALRHQEEIPHYCYHPGLSIVANCRICLAEVWSPDPKTGALRAGNKLFPTCQTPAMEGQVVYTDSPKAVGNQKAVMEFLLINHPVDCAVCDQAGECHLQDYSYQYGRGESRFKESKNKRPKKDVGPHVLLYSDRCIMCTRCVRFTREVTGTAELLVEGRGSVEEIDVFPGVALDNELSGNVVDICPVGALLDKDFLFQQRVWFLTKTPGIDGITASGDNISIEHNNGRIYRVKPRDNPEVNKWWITDEVRYGWKFVHREDRLRIPSIKGRKAYATDDAGQAWDDALAKTVEHLEGAAKSGGRLGLMVSPMLTCEDAYLLASFMLSIDSKAELAVGPIPVLGQDKTFPGGFTMCAEKAPNARGVRRVLEALAKGRSVLDAAGFERVAASRSIAAAVVTGNYPSEWATPALQSALAGVNVILIDTLPGPLGASAEVTLPGATWTEKAGSFENAKGRLQGFEKAIVTLDFAKGEGQIALDLRAARAGAASRPYNATAVRSEMARVGGLEKFATELHAPPTPSKVAGDMVLVEI
ncbi:MAG: (2Fe-2S)-binding protein [Planctomycetes bacterium]|nr:(2Fe-2S)-binding protein [Planctomycetota bacterium]